MGPQIKKADGPDDHLQAGGSLTCVDPEDIEGSLPGHRIRDPWEYPRTDLGQAELLRDRHSDKMRWCPAADSWFIYDGRRWRQDTDNVALDLANEATRWRKGQAVKLDDKARAGEMAWCNKAEMTRGRDGCLRQAMSFPVMMLNPDDLDRDPWTLCSRLS